MVLILLLALGGWSTASGEKKIIARKPEAVPKGYRIPKAPVAPRLVQVSRIYEKESLLVLEETFTDLLVASKPPSDGRDKEGRAVTFKEYLRFSLKEGRAFLANGKQIAEDELVKRLSAGSVVLLAADERGRSPQYRTMLKDDAIILIGKTEYTGVSYFAPTSPK